VVAAVALAAVPPPAASAPGDPATPIRHVVSLMQADRSFDTYFGTFPGADGIPRGTCQPVSLQRRDAGCVRPFHLGDRPVAPLENPIEVFDRQRNGGRMDGFVAAYPQVGSGLHRSVMGYYDGRDLPYAWETARRFVLFDRYFASARAGTLANHMFWMTGRRGTNDEDRIPPGGFDEPTIFDRLDERGVSWRVYVENYDPGVTYRDPGGGSRRSQPRTVPLLAYERFLTDPERFWRIVDLETYFDDLRDGTLPAVSYIVTSASSERTPGSIPAGQRLARSLVDALIRSSSWKSSAFLWTYDDWGGWYDHVDPPRVDRHGYGFRVPALLISPYAPRGRVDHTRLDHTSLLRFITDNWHLEPLAQRDARANSIAAGLAFDRPPRPPRLMAAPTPGRAEPPGGRAVVMALYGAAVVLAVALIAVARRERRRSAA
jgi:phospholipase C